MNTKRRFSFFRSLRGRLTLTYILITALTPLVIVFITLFLAGYSIVNRSNETEYVQDVIAEFKPRSWEYVLDAQGNEIRQSIYWQDGEPNAEELQIWLDSEVADGYASPHPQGLLDSAAAAIDFTVPVTIITPDRKVIAQSPRMNIGEQLPSDFMYEFDAASLEAGGNYIANLPDGYFLALSLTIPRTAEQLALAIPEPDKVGAVILLKIASAPALAGSRLMYIATIAALGSGSLLLVILPLGALFGYISARGLTRRIEDLALTADAYSVGNFAARPKLQRNDELGELGLRLTTMAEQIQQLLQSNHQLAIVEERNRLARDLHDTVKQQNFATLMQVRAAKLRLNEPVKAEGFLESAEALLKQSQDELHNLIGELRPAALQNTGLATAIQRLTEEWTAHSHIPCDVRVRGERTLPLPVEQTLYRVAQEGLANVSKHSSAETVTLTLDYTPKTVTLILQDDGEGFNVNGRYSGFGLSTMRQRLEEQNGQLIVDSQPAIGTTITATVGTK